MCDSITTYHIKITGVVQGVGFRPFVYNLAQQYKLGGWVLNHSGGVDIEIEGPEYDAQRFLVALQEEAPPIARIESLNYERVNALGMYDVTTGTGHFEIRHSQAVAGEYLLISPDVATCPDCLQELFDPGDRRYRYPFINCTNCGPRFTIIEDIPYDRPKTTMRVFPMCKHCQAEYDAPVDRRFHAQPNACPECGPHIWLQVRDGSLVGSETDANNKAVLARALVLLRKGAILAIKGLGGFHLACDATNAEAVARLRERKHRPHKPFAIMVQTKEQARALCEVSPEAEALLTSVQSPIVLLPQREHTPIADNVAPNSATLGIMLAYTPLHHLLLHDIAVPLVMTSGNLTEEPITKENAEALERLASLADAFLLHNRDIYARYDDSVWQFVSMEDGELLQPIRRARGYAPFPVRLPFVLPRIFATGPLLKNTFTLTRDTYGFVSQHIGDLENLDTLEHYESALATYQHLFRLEPELVTCDMHPDYLSTRFAQQFAIEHGLSEPIAVQHHQAHIAACLADNGWSLDAGPVIGVAFDGTGYGEDGHIWGGEWFIGDYHGFQRAAHLEYLPLAGGDVAVRQPRRIAAGYLYVLLEQQDLPTGLFCPADTMMLHKQIDYKLNTPLTSSMGRLFDAVSALLGVCEECSYEAQAAIELEQLLYSTEFDGEMRYPYDMEHVDGLVQVRVARLFEALVDALAQQVPVAEISAAFHLTVADMVVRVCALLRKEYSINTVALSGGVFQNRHLTAMAYNGLRARGFEVLLHRNLPSNDGGVSVGQAVLAHFANIN